MRQHDSLCAVCVETSRSGCQHPQCPHRLGAVAAAAPAHPLTASWVPTAPAMPNRGSEAPLPDLAPVRLDLETKPAMPRSPTDKVAP